MPIHDLRLAIQGDPDAIRSSGSRWIAFGAQASDARGRILTEGLRSAAEFVGSEGSQHSEYLLERASPDLDAVSAAWNTVGTALMQYADKLAECQQRLGHLAEALAKTEMPREPSSRGDRQADLMAMAAKVIHIEHEAAVRECCRAIDGAKQRAPHQQSDFAGLRPSRRSGTSGAHGRFSKLMSVSGSLRIASTTSTQFPLKSEEADPSEEEIRERIRSSCVLEYGTSLFGNVDMDVEAACIAYADAAMSDPTARKLVYDRYPQVENPAQPEPGGWDDIVKYLGTVGQAVTVLLGVEGCLESIGSCTTDLAIGAVPLGRVGKIGADAARAAGKVTKGATSGSRMSEGVARVAPKPRKVKAPKSPQETVPNGDVAVNPSQRRPPGNRANELGAQREQRVAELTGGTVSGEAGKQGLQVVKPGIGRTDVDVIGPNGEYIVVGGPAKGYDRAAVAKAVQKLTIVKYCANLEGVRAIAYFARDTPQHVLDLATKHLGENNVRLFDLSGG